MSRDLLGRPPLRASELSPDQVRLYPGEPRAITCPGCGRWQVPHDGGLRRHARGIDGMGDCPESGRRVWFDLSSPEWRARLEVAVREASSRSGQWAYRQVAPRSSGRRYAGPSGTCPPFPCRLVLLDLLMPRPGAAWPGLSAARRWPDAQ